MTTWVADTEPYAWPYDGRLDGEHLALVLAGWDEAWAARALEPGPAVAACVALAAAVREVGGMVVAVEHALAAPPGRAAPVVPSPPIAVGPGGVEPDVVVAAAGIDGFHAGPLDPLLRSHGRTHLLVAGHGIEAAVHSTLRSANDRGYECLLVADACSALTDDLAFASAHTVTMSGGIFGAVGTTAAVLAALAAQVPAASATGPGDAPESVAPAPSAPTSPSLEA